MPITKLKIGKKSKKDSTKESKKTSDAAGSSKGSGEIHLIKIVRLYKTSSLVDTLFDTMNTRNDKMENFIIPY